MFSPECIVAPPRNPLYCCIVATLLWLLERSTKPPLNRDKCYPSVWLVNGVVAMSLQLRMGGKRLLPNSAGMLTLCPLDHELSRVDFIHMHQTTGTK